MFVTRRALTGRPGLLTSSLRAQMRFDLEVHHGDLTRLLDEQFHLVVCGAPVGIDAATSVEGIEQDQRDLAQLARVLSHVRTRHLVVLSTVAVYCGLASADEATDVDTVAGTSWARHHYWFEQKLREHHPSMVVLRLPLAFGPADQGPRELLDLERGVVPSGLTPDAALQCYDTARLAHDLDVAVAAGLPLANLVGEPVSVRDLAQACFGVTLPGPLGADQRTDVRTLHADVFSGTGGYVMDRAAVIDAVAGWARRRLPVAAVGGT
jgi:hypothetical protein